MKKKQKIETEELKTPKPARRSMNKKSTMRSGRTIGEKRERLETASERAAIHKKNQKRKKFRFSFTVLGFAVVTLLIIFAVLPLLNNREEDEPYTPTIVVPYAPTIEVIDEDNGGITSRMKEYIGQAEADFRELGYMPVKAVIPTGSIREIDFYLDGYTGHIKLTLDRGTAVSVEDADRTIRHLAGNGINDFQYIDVRIEGKAYWK
ncbi:MAG: hypothetical protein Q4B65_02170 [Candidatus Saccharibacteria bacterium]|nr:hypothetical protein [Candidatus Saccharibacteria bacterium]